MASTKRRKKGSKWVPFDIFIKISATGERFLLKNVHAEMKIRELKCYAELVTGIPANLQRLLYLDEGDMLDDTDLRHNDVVAGATINLKLWRMWEKLVAAVALGSVNDVLKEGVISENSLGSADPAVLKSRFLSSKQRSAVALYIASHRGHNHLLRTLIDETNADVNMKTPFGRTPLHVAASQGHSNTIDLMLEKGASMDVTDVQGKTPLMIASQCGFKDTERHLFLFQWQTRAAKTKARKRNDALMMHQQFDSAFPTWLRGHYGQRYYCSTLPPGEFAGTGFSAPRRRKDEAGVDGLYKSELPPIEDPQVLEAIKPSDESSQYSGVEAEEISHGSKYSHSAEFFTNGSSKLNKKPKERTLSSKSPQSATSSKSVGSHKTFEEWMEDKKLQKGKERQNQKLRIQMEREQEHIGKKSRGKVEDWRIPQQFKKNQSSSPNRTVRERVEFQEQYQPSWDHISHPNREYRRISSIREDPDEGYNFLRVSFDLWPRRLPSDAILKK